MNINNLDLSKKVVVRNVTNIPAHFVAVIGGRYDAQIPARGEITLTTEEVMHQIRTNNPLFIGYSREKKGHHAELYIDCPDIRREAGFETDNYKQELMTMESMVNFFETPRLAELKRALRHKILTWNDRQLLMTAIKENRITNYERVQVAQEFLKDN